MNILLRYRTPFLLLFLIVPLFYSCEYSTPEIFLIPKGYIGPINIIYNQKQGAEIKYENGKRLYEIPSTGTLFTKFKDEYGIIDQEYYYVTNSGVRNKIGILDVRDFNNESTLAKNKQEPPRDSIAIFNPASTGEMSRGKEKLKFQSTFVGSYNDLIKINRDIDFEDIDSLRRENKNGM